MTFIPRQLKVERDMLTIRLERDVHETLQQYTEFLESSRDYVIGETLRVAFAKDREFQQWLTTRTPSTVETAPPAIGRGRRRRSHEVQGRGAADVTVAADAASI